MSLVSRLSTPEVARRIGASACNVAIGEEIEAETNQVRRDLLRMHLRTQSHPLFSETLLLLARNALPTICIRSWRRHRRMEGPRGRCYWGGGAARVATMKLEGWTVRLGGAGALLTRGSFPLPSLEMGTLPLPLPLTQVGILSSEPESEEDESGVKRSQSGSSLEWQQEEVAPAKWKSSANGFSLGAGAGVAVGEEVVGLGREGWPATGWLGHDSRGGEGGGGDLILQESSRLQLGRGAWNTPCVHDGRPEPSSVSRNPKNGREARF
jgi:hypothetical protein